MWATIHIGDALDRLRNLRDECVQCVEVIRPKPAIAKVG